METFLMHKVNLLLSRLHVRCSFWEHISVALRVFCFQGSLRTLHSQTFIMKVNIPCCRWSVQLHLILVLLWDLHLTSSSSNCYMNLNCFSVVLYFTQHYRATGICRITKAVAVCLYCHIVINTWLMLESYDCTYVYSDLGSSPEWTKSVPS